MNFYNDENYNFIEPLRDFQTYDSRQMCTAGCQIDGAYLDRQQHIFYLNKLNNNIFLDFLWDGNCRFCNSAIDVMPEFTHITPNFLMVEPHVGRRILFHEMSET